MTLNSESLEFTWSVPRSNTLHGSVRRALRLSTGVIAAGLALGVAPIASAEPFPAVIPLSSLFPAGGGDGNRGFVLTGINEADVSGSVSAAGDVNGDGIGDLIIGACLADPGGDVGAGESYVVFGSTAGFPAVLPLGSLYPAGGGDGTGGFVLRGIDVLDTSGCPVSAAGDVNGDGIGDLIIGAHGADPGGDSYAGESYVVFGSTAGFPAVLPLGSLFPAGGGDGTRGFVLTGIDVYDWSGWSVSAAGDVNGDGISDLIVGARFATPGGDTYAGASYVVFGSTTGFPAVLPLGSLFPAGGGDGTRGFVLTGIAAFDQSGISVSAAGDINGDGIGDLIVGAIGAASPGGDSYAGASYVVFGSTAGFPAVLPLGSLFPAGGGDGTGGFVLTGIDAYDGAGSSVSAAGDVNGDGIDDIIVGGNSADPGGDFQAGESYVVFGSTAAFPAVLPLGTLYPAGGGDGTGGFVLTGIDAYDGAGSSVSAAGDVNGDGVGDIIVGAPFAAPGGDFQAGESYVVFGSTAGFPAVLPLGTLYPAGGGDGTGGFVLTGIDASDGSGGSVSAAGDVNGDGIGDLMIGAGGADPGGDSSAGESYVVFGRSATQ